MLRLDGVTCCYGDACVVSEVSLTVGRGEVVALLGRNGAGKTTLVEGVMGLTPVREGSITLDGVELVGRRPDEIARLGVALVPQGRRLFPDLTVEEHLTIGLLVRGGGAEVRARVLDLFPVLRERRRQRAGTLSAGEQQMVATARALCATPTVLLMDEPSEGLMPLLLQRLLGTVDALKEEGVGVLLVEQNVGAALRVSDAAAIMEEGRIVWRGEAAALQADPAPLRRYLGVNR